MNGMFGSVLLAMAIAVPASADFTQTGAITATSSMTASAFFGDGSHLSGIPNGDVTQSGNNSFTGVNSFSNTVALSTGMTVNVSTSSAGPSSNTLYSVSFAKAWGAVNGTTIQEAYNIASASSVSTCQTDYTFKRPMKTANYALLCSAGNAAQITFDQYNCTVTNKSTTGFRLIIDRAGTCVAVDASFVVFGQQ